MKIRTDYVTNSSSSSYLIAAAIVTDKVEFFKWLKKYRYLLEESSCYLMSGNDSNRFSVGSIIDDYFILESFNSSIRLNSKINEDDFIVYVDGYEGSDNDFWDEENEEYDYDVDISFFSDKLDMMKLFNELKDNPVFKDFKYSVGAGRDG